MANTIVSCENNQSMDNDLEDGEIEDDDDEEVIIEPETIKDTENTSSKTDANKKSDINISSDIINLDSSSKGDKDFRSSGGHRDRRERSERHHHKHEKSSRKRSANPTDLEAISDDWAGNVEKAIASIIKKEKDKDHRTGKSDEEKSDEHHDSNDEKRRGKKRRRKDKERKKKRRKSTDEIKGERETKYLSPPPDDDIDEDEMICIRGGSPKPAVTSQMIPPPMFSGGGDSSPYGGQYNEPPSYDSAPSSDYDSDYHENRAKRSFSRERERKRDRSSRNRESSRRDRKSKSDKNRERRSEKNRPVLQDSNNLCLFYMQGKCHKVSHPGEECQYSHAAMPPMKLELCKFYLMDCCAKRDKCLYMHSEFPCKYYHTGLRCVPGERGQCKFAHGGPLSENLKQVLLKHLETAPKELLGDFPRLSREGAHSLVNATQKKLEGQYNSDGTVKSGGIPSLFDINVSIPKEMVSSLNDQENKMNDHQKSNSSKQPRSRPSRWGSEKDQIDINQLMLQMNPNNFNTNNSNNSGPIQSVFDNLNAQDQQKIQMYNMSFKFPAFYSDKGDQDMRIVSNGDVDMRALPPAMATQHQDVETSTNTANSNSARQSPDKTAKDVEKSEAEKALMDQDMRFLPAAIPSSTTINEETTTTNKTYVDSESHNLEIDNSLEEERELQIDEPVEDEPLKIDMKDDDEGDNNSVTERHSDMDDLPSNLPRKQRELFMRIKAQQKENLLKDDKEKSDDEIVPDEDWYSDDDDEDNAPLSNVLKNLNTSNSKKETNVLKDEDLRPAEIKPPTIEPLTLQSGSNIINTDFGKVDISAEVTKLLSLVKNQTNQSLQGTTTTSATTTTSSSSHHSSTSNLSDPRSSHSRDPRHRDTNSTTSNTQHHTSSSGDTKSKSSSSVLNDPRVKRKQETKIPKISIYELGSIDPVSVNESRRDIDLRSFGDTPKDLDLRVSNYGDTDLRPGGRSDIDLRQLNLPFKPMQNYVPATEIDASINSHPPIPYKVHICDIPRPDFSGLKLNPKDAQNSPDPRIRKIFRLSIAKASDEIRSPEPSPSSPKSHSASENSPKSSHSVSVTNRADPRMQRKQSVTADNKDTQSVPPSANTTSHIQSLEQITSSTNGTNLDYNQQIQLLQNSSFYQGLNSNQKLVLNQAITSQKSEQSSVQNDPILAAVLANLGLTTPLNINPSGMLNPAFSIMSLLNLGTNFNQMNLTNMNTNSMGPPSLLGPGPTPLMAANLGNMSGMVGGPTNGGPNDFQMGGFGGPGAGGGTGLLGHSPYQSNLGGGMVGPGDFQFNDGGGGVGPGAQFFGGNSDFGGNNNKRTDRNYNRGERQNRRGRGGGNWNSGSNRHGGGGNRGGNFQSRNSRSNNRSNRSRTPP